MVDKNTFLVFYGSRATQFRLKTVLDGLKENKDINLILEEIYVSGASQAADVFTRIYNICKAQRPTVAIVCGDRYETLAAAMGATYAAIPLIHLQGGDISGTLDDRIRHAVTKLSDYHFAYSQRSKDRIYWMKEERDRIFYLGDPAKEHAIQLSNLPLNPIYKNKPYVISMLHPDLYFPIKKEQLDNYFHALLSFSKANNLCVYHFMPNFDPGANLIKTYIEEHEKNLLYRVIDNMPPQDFIPFLKYAEFIIGNSSCGLREASTLKVRAINVGNRQEGREIMGNIIQSSFNEEDLIACMNKKIPLAYEDDSYKEAIGAGKRIASKIISL